MAGPMTKVRYTDGRGNNYFMRMDASNAAAVGCGAAQAGDAEKPSALKPRYIWAEHPTNGKRRKLPVCSTTAPVWTGTDGVNPVTTVSLPDFDNGMAATNYVIGGRIDEKRYAR